MQKVKYELDGMVFDLEHETIKGLFDLMADIRDHQDKQADPVFELESIVVSMHDGKMYYRAKGGNFKKFGVAVWDEVLIDTFKAAGLQKLQKEGKAEFKKNGVRWLAECEMKPNGQPKKIVKIWSEPNHD